MASTPTMKAYRFNTKGGKLERAEVPIPNPGPDQVRIKVLTCGICHTDAGIQFGGFANQWPRTPGHEVAGIVDEIGSNIRNFKKGDYVGVGWFGENCGDCLHCRQNCWVNCQRLLATGDHIDGGYAEFMVAHKNAVARIPEGVDPKDAGPMMCGGMTTFNALRRSGAVPGDVVVVQGVGGLGHFGVQWANKMGFYTVALSRGADKVELATKLGAHLSIDTSKQDAVAEIQKLGGAKIILITAPSAKSIEELVPAIGLNGTILIVAVLMEEIKINTIPLLVKNASIRVWASGDSRDGEDCLKFAKDHGVKPMVEVFPLDKAPEAYEHMLANKVRFRAVLEVSKK